jgi:hypothetical protein
MIKINLPNPREMSVPEFFAQMRIALKSAEKSYEEIIKDVDLKEPIDSDDVPWISFRLGKIDEFIKEEKGNENPLNALDGFLCEDEAQEIYLEIDRL